MPRGDGGPGLTVAGRFVFVLFIFFLARSTEFHAHSSLPPCDSVSLSYFVLAVPTISVGEKTFARVPHYLYQY